MPGLSSCGRDGPMAQRYTFWLLTAPRLLGLASAAAASSAEFIDH